MSDVIESPIIKSGLNLAVSTRAICIDHLAITNVNTYVLYSAAIPEKQNVTLLGSVYMC